MIAVGEEGDAVVIVFDRKAAKQRLTDDEADTLHRQLGLQISTKLARKAKDLRPAPVPADSNVAFIGARGSRQPFEPIPNASAKRPAPVVKRQPMLEDSPVSAAEAASAMEDAVRRDAEALAASYEEKRRKAMSVASGEEEPTLDPLGLEPAPNGD